jgi:hypothetical protein
VNPLRGAALVGLLLAAGCGGRTGLLVIEEDGGRPMDSSRPPPDSTVPPFDAGQDASPDAEPDVGPDVLPPIDAMFSDVVMVNNCPDAGATLVYVLTAQNQLFSFYPPTQVFTFIGTISCPTASPMISPFSMAVDRTGTAFSVFTDNNLYQVDTATAACVSTPFVPGQSGFTTFGMGFVSDSNDTGETLFVADSAFNTMGGRGNSMGIASIDTMAFALNFVGPFTPAIPGPELTGTGDGRLFGFYTNQTGTGSHIVEIDKTTGNLLADNPLQVGNPNDAYAFAFWGGSFWVFTSPGGPSQVTQFNPADMSETPMTTMSGTIVGAGVSTCAPQ